MAENKTQSLQIQQSNSSGLYQQNTITQIPMPQQQNLFGPTQAQSRAQLQNTALSSIPLRPSMISQDTPLTDMGQSANTITNLQKSLPTNIHSEQQVSQQMSVFPMQFPQIMQMPSFMPGQQSSLGQAEGQNQMINMMMPQSLQINPVGMPMMQQMNPMAGIDPNSNMMMDQNMMQFQLQQQIQSIQMMQANIMQLGQQFQQQDFTLTQQDDVQNQNNLNSRRPSNISGLSENASTTQPYPYNQIGNQNRPNMVPSIDMKKLQEQQAMMASMPSNQSKSITPGGHTNFSQLSASQMNINQPIQFDLTQGQISQVNGINQRNQNNLGYPQQNSHSNDESPINKFSRDSQNMLSSSKKMSPNKNQKLQENNNETTNQYELSSKKNSSETAGLLGAQSSSKQYNLSPDGPETQLKQIQEQEAMTSEEEDNNLNASNNQPNNNSKMPAFDSSPINEDDEYDKIQYQPTPQFIDYQKLQGAYSGRGLDRRVSQGSVANQGTVKRLISGESMQTILKVPGAKKKVQEIDIDGELVSKVSKANLTGNIQPHYPGEFQQNPMNQEFHNELDEFLMDQEEEVPKIELQNEQTIFQTDQVVSATKITNAKELKELDGLVMDKSSQLIDLDKHLEKSKDSLRLPNTVASPQGGGSPRSQNSKRKKSQFDKLRITVNKSSESEMDQSANQLRHDKSLSSHKFSEYNEEPNQNLIENYLNLQSNKRNKNLKVSSPSAVDFNELVDQQSIASKRKQQDQLIEVKSGSSSSSLQHMASIAVIEASTPRKIEKDHLQISKYKSVQQTKPKLVKDYLQRDSPEKPQTIQSSRKSHSAGQWHQREPPKIDIELVESREIINANYQKELKQRLPSETSDLVDTAQDNQQVNIQKEQNVSQKLDIILEQCTDPKQNPASDENKKQLDFLLQQIQLMQFKAEELQQRLGQNQKEVSKPVLGQQYSQSSLFAGLKDSSPESKSPSKIMLIKNTSLPPSSKQSPAVNKKFMKSTSKISSDGSTMGGQNFQKLKQKFNSQSYQQMNSRKLGDQSYEISESINISNGAEFLREGPNRMATVKSKLPDQIKEIESEKNSSDIQRSIWKNSVVLQPKLKLKNTTSTQNLPTPKDSFQHQKSLISSTDQEPIQTDRPDLKTNEKLQSNPHFQPHSKSYNKDEVLLQLISAEQTYNLNKPTQQVKPQLQSTKPSTQQHHLIEPSPKSHLFSRQIDPSPKNYIQPNQKIQKAKPQSLEIDNVLEMGAIDESKIKIVRRAKIQEESSEVIQRKFKRVFKDIFKGYQRKMQYKMEEKQFQIQQQTKNKGNFQLQDDFEDVIQYTQTVNLNVLQALKDGVFQSNSNIGNLMHEEDQLFFGNQQKQISPIAQKTQTDQTDTNFEFSEILKMQNIQLKNELLHKHLENRARKQILLTNEDLFNDYSHLYKDATYVSTLHAKHLLIDNKKRRQRLEAKKQHAEILLKEEREKYKHQHQERQLKIEVDKLERKEKVEMRIRKMSLERQVKLKMWKEQRKVHTSLVRQKPLFKRLEENSKFQEQKYDENRQNFLKARRSQFKPIIKEQLEDFAEKIDIIAGHLKMKKEEERLKQQQNDSFDPNKLKSSIYKNVVSQDKLSKQKSDLEFQKKNDLITKKQNYSKYIKMVHRPSADEQKQVELKNRIENLKHPVKGQFKYPPGMTMAQLSLRSGINPDYEFMQKRNSSRLSMRQKISSNSKSQQVLPLISSVDSSDHLISQNQKLPTVKLQKPLRQNKSYQSISLKNQRQSNLAHLEQYEENKFLNKQKSFKRYQSDEKVKKDYIREMREQRQNKESKNSKRKEMSALEKLNQLEQDIKSDKFGSDDKNEEKWL